jgi:hypothetical protein
MTSVIAGRVEYRAVRQHGSRALLVAWRYRISRAERWLTCGTLVPDNDGFLVRGWDGEPLGIAGTVRDGIETVRRHYTRLALGSAEATWNRPN